MEDLAPVVLFVYNRPEHTKKTITALVNNSLAHETSLFIYSDAPKNDIDAKSVEQVRKYCRGIKGFKEVHIVKRNDNMGLANSIISGVTEVINKYEKVIVLEDDLVTSTDFLNYMNDALYFYAEDMRIWSVTGYCPEISIPKSYEHDVYLSLRPSSWGWGTWRNRWTKIDWEVKDYNVLLNDKKKQRAFNKGGNDLFGMLQRQMKNEIDSWAIRWSYSQFVEQSYTVFPVKTKIAHIGVGVDSTHYKNKTMAAKISLSTEPVRMKRDLNTDPRILAKFKKNQMTVVRRELRNLAKSIGIYDLLYKIFAK